MPTENKKVKHILEFLEAKLQASKAKQAEYDAPIMQEILKSNPHLQMDYIRLKAQQEAYEDSILAILKFNDDPKAKKDRQDRKG